MGVTHHSDVEDVKQVKRQRSNKIDEEPCGQVVEANGTRSRDHLAGLGHIGGAEVQDDIWGCKRLLLGGLGLETQAKGSRNWISWEQYLETQNGVGGRKGEDRLGFWLVLREERSKSCRGQGAGVRALKDP